MEKVKGDNLSPVEGEKMTEKNGDSRIVVDKTAITIKSTRINLEFGRCSQIS